VTFRFLFERKPSMVLYESFVNNVTSQTGALARFRANEPKGREQKITEVPDRPGKPNYEHAGKWKGD
jgi:hypothetical protein